MSEFKIPNSSETYIVLQRTSYMSFLAKIMKKIGFNRFYDNHLAPIIEEQRTDEIRDKYFDDLNADYLEIKNYLPKNATNILDIGSGMAGIDLFLFNHYEKHSPNLFLLDKQGVSEIYYNFENDAAYYNSFDLAKQLLRINGVPEENVFAIDISKKTFPNHIKFDLVISLISWGFHYPVSTYLEDVSKSLSNNGRLIIDIRKETDGKKELEKVFNNVYVITDKEKHTRIVCYNNPRI